ncbi:unnamed protein product [Didymodactylos carnosus]|uniref:Uncharacterized protein n=1 Tax=Didymodactylos carnosus TaxID=1234261 RepID=A0A815QK16_9BILA|nr:unnamed protein product [Didymodactylos carnosus]CAF1462989.1 unnamed protein product [Didymodactylos carnosus]CAF4130614.1 unnamed protein product [Didymodactylos carnosus]CAF4332826.1 unnamed protein product [Didymodactylos carnosus]
MPVSSENKNGPYKPQPIKKVSTTTVVNPGFFAYTNLTGCQPYYCAEQVHLINNITVTALTIIIRVQKTSAATYHGVANNFWTGYINSNHTDNGSQIIYTFVLDPTQTVVASTTWYVEAQMDLYGTSQVTSADTYTVSVTGGGITNSYSGHF